MSQPTRSTADTQSGTVVGKITNRNAEDEVPSSGGLSRGGTESTRGKQNHLYNVHQMAGKREQTAAAASIPQSSHKDQQAACRAFVVQTPDDCYPTPVEG